MIRGTFAYFRNLPAHVPRAFKVVSEEERSSSSPSRRSFTAGSTPRCRRTRNRSGRDLDHDATVPNAAVDHLTDEGPYSASNSRRP